MNIPTGKIEKAASKDSSRPVLGAVNLKTDADGTRWLEATDSYKLVRIPAYAEDTDTDGLIPAAAFVEARKCRGSGSITANGDVTYTLKAGGTATAPRIDGQFPSTAQLFPSELGEFSVTLNARLLLDVAEALGGRSGNVTLRFCADTDTKRANLRPITIDAPDAEGKALLMPVRRDG